MAGQIFFYQINHRGDRSRSRSPAQRHRSDHFRSHSLPSRHQVPVDVSDDEVEDDRGQEDDPAHYVKQGEEQGDGANEKYA